MHANPKTWNSLTVLAGGLALALIFAAGCEGDGGGGGGGSGDHDFGDRDPSSCAALGDSITVGYGDAGAPWPVRLSEKLGRPVANYGVTGMRMGQAGGLLTRILAGEAGYVIIALGVNDAIDGTSPDDVKGALAAMIGRIQAAQAVAVVGNATRMAGAREVFNPRVDAINRAIREVCGDTGAIQVNLHSAVPARRLQADGLHPNSEGEEAIARAFYSALKGRQGL